MENTNSLNLILVRNKENVKQKPQNSKKNYQKTTFSVPHSFVFGLLAESKHLFLAAGNILQKNAALQKNEHLRENKRKKEHCALYREKHRF